MKKYKITYISNDTVIDVTKKSSDDGKYDEDVLGSISAKHIEILAYSADHAELKFYKSFMSSTANNLIKVLDVCEIPVNENDIHTFRVCIDYRSNNLEKSYHNDILVQAISPQQAELFVLRSFCNSDKCAIHVHAL